MALGKGLSALIPEKTQDIINDTSQSISNVKEIEVSSIQDNRFQPRQNYDETRLIELMESIKAKGFLQPIVVRKFKDGYEVIAGERRLKAARKLGLEKIPVLVKEATDKEVLELALVENIQREDLNPIEKAISYQRFIEEFGYAQEDVAKAIGKDRVTVSNLLRLLKLPNEIRNAIIDGKISEGHARALVSIDDLNTQMMVFWEILNKGLSVRDVEARVRRIMSTGKAHSKKRVALKDPEILVLEEELRHLFGTKVIVDNKRGNKGRLLIEYYSLQDFDRILSVMRNK